MFKREPTFFSDELTVSWDIILYLLTSPPPQKKKHTKKKTQNKQQQKQTIKLAQTFKTKHYFPI